MEDARYTNQDEKNAREAADKLREYARVMEKFMSPHAIATSFLAVGLNYAHQSLPANAVAGWLKGVADEIEEQGYYLQDNNPVH